MMPITLSSLVIFIPIQKTYKIFSKDTFKELVKGMREWRIDMNELKKNKRAISLLTFRKSKEFVKKYMYCDRLKHDKKDCSYYDEELKSGVIFYKEGRVRFTTIEYLWNSNLEEEI